MNWIRKARRALQSVAKYTPVALPYIQMAAVLTPSTVDDAGLAWLKRKYPRFFNGEPLTEEEMGVFRFVVASERLELNESLSTTEARVKVQSTYADLKASEEYSDAEPLD